MAELVVTWNVTDTMQASQPVPEGMPAGELEKAAVALAAEGKAEVIYCGKPANIDWVLDDAKGE